MMDDEKHDEVQEVSKAPLMLDCWILPPELFGE
jgi:hypothetical protein